MSLARACKNHIVKISAGKNVNHDHCQRRNPNKGLPGQSDFQDFTCHGATASSSGKINAETGNGCSKANQVTSHVKTYHM